MTSAVKIKPVAVLGGTFDPVHHGHLRLAIDIAETLGVEELRLMPGYQPVHRNNPSATAEQRLKMLQLAVEDIDILTVDDRELRRKGPSYTLLSLQEIRAEIGGDKPLYFILGEDAFNQFDSWYQWKDLINYAHLLVAVRPGKHPDVSGELKTFIHENEYKGDGFPQTPSGNLVWLDNPMLEIASRDIRQRIIHNKNIRYLLPVNVFNYLESLKIYR